jgi:hypothetical protein
MAKTDFRTQGSAISRFAIPLLLVSFLLVEIACAFRIFRHDGVFLPRADARLSTLSSIHFAIADFDGDWKPDLALVEATNLQRLQSDYAIHFQFGAGRRLSVFFSAPAGGIRLAARDVNGDDLPDLVVSSALDKRVVAVLLNQGHGEFSQAEPTSYLGIPVDPSTFFHVGERSIADRYTVLSMRYSFDGERVGRATSLNTVAAGAVRIGEQLVPASSELHARPGRSPPRGVTYLA